MKIIEPSYEILTSLPGKGAYALRDIETAARTCYKSEDKSTNDGVSAIALATRLIKNGHEVPIEFYDITVRFICDRGVSHELVRHRLASFCQESTRYCNYSKDKFGNEITVIEPVSFLKMPEEQKQLVRDIWESKPGAKVGNTNNIYWWYSCWYNACKTSEWSYMAMLDEGCQPEIARSVLPTCLKTEVIMKANLREWRHILELRTSERAHPEMRRLMIPLLCELHGRIPVIFDDIYDKVVVK